MDHKMKEILQALVDGKTIMYKNFAGVWLKASPGQVFTLLSMGYPDSAVQDLKVVEPTTIRIGNMDVPEPLREAPIYGQKYWTIWFDNLGLVQRYTWIDDKVDHRLLERGLIHLERENAIIHANALIKVSGGQV